MTPEEKAKELVDKYYNLFSVELENTVHYSEAKECALLTIDYIITSNPHSNPLNSDVHSTMNYWMEVKREIKKL
jgi:hypothetical protein